MIARDKVERVRELLAALGVEEEPSIGQAVAAEFVERGIPFDETHVESFVRGVEIVWNTLREDFPEISSPDHPLFGHYLAERITALSVYDALGGGR